MTFQEMKEGLKQLPRNYPTEIDVYNRAVEDTANATLECKQLIQTPLNEN